VTEFSNESPTIAGSAINQNKSKPIAPHRDAITKNDIHVDDIEKSVGNTIKRCAPFCLQNSSVWAKRHRKLAIINPFIITTNIENMIAVSELPTVHNAMDFLQRPMGFSVGGVGSVAWTDIRKRGVGMMK
jgi:hypothetical protein